jgi:uncharacterized membrane protein
VPHSEVSRRAGYHAGGARHLRDLGLVYGSRRIECRGLMLRKKINRISAIAPLVMSALAFILVLIAVASGWDAGRTDEGSAAHIFHLLIALQLPFVVAFLLTADWKRVMRVAATLSFQVAAIALAFGPVAYFKL